MIASDFPITMLTAVILAVIYIGLCVFVVRMRLKTRTSIGHGNKDLERAYRTQSNFIEYVPITLILMLLVENTMTNPVVLIISAGMLITGRIMHPFGLYAKRAINALRSIGMLLTFAAILTLAISALLLFL